MSEDDDKTRRPRRQSQPQPNPSPGSRITPFNRTNKLPGGTSRLPSPDGPYEAPAQASPFGVRLDPNGKPGEFNFVIESPELTSRVPAHQEGMDAEASGAIPPVLYKAVDEILGFIYGLDQQFENQGRRGRK